MVIRTGLKTILLLFSLSVTIYHNVYAEDEGDISARKCSALETDQRADCAVKNTTTLAAINSWAYQAPPGYESQVILQLSALLGLLGESAMYAALNRGMPQELVINDEHSFYSCAGFPDTKDARSKILKYHLRMTELKLSIAGQKKRLYKFLSMLNALAKLIALEEKIHHRNPESYYVNYFEALSLDLSIGILLLNDSATGKNINFSEYLQKLPPLPDNQNYQKVKESARHPFPHNDTDPDDILHRLSSIRKTILAAQAAQWTAENLYELNKKWQEELGGHHLALEKRGLQQSRTLSSLKEYNISKITDLLCVTSNAGGSGHSIQKPCRTDRKPGNILQIKIPKRLTETTEIRTPFYQYLTENYHQDAEKYKYLLDQIYLIANEMFRGVFSLNAREEVQKNDTASGIYEGEEYFQKWILRFEKMFKNLMDNLTDPNDEYFAQQLVNPNISYHQNMLAPDKTLVALKKAPGPISGRLSKGKYSVLDRLEFIEENCFSDTYKSVDEINRHVLCNHPDLKKEKNSACKLHRDYLNKYKNVIYKSAKDFNLPPALYTCLIHRESGGWKGGSFKRGRGLTQLTYVAMEEICQSINESKNSDVPDKDKRKESIIWGRLNIEVPENLCNSHYTAKDGVKTRVKRYFKNHVTDNDNYETTIPMSAIHLSRTKAFFINLVGKRWFNKQNELDQNALLAVAYKDGSGNVFNLLRDNNFNIRKMLNKMNRVSRGHYQSVKNCMKKGNYIYAGFSSKKQKAYQKKCGLPGDYGEYLKKTCPSGRALDEK